MKYMGSKQRIARYLIPILQEIIDKQKIKVYYEPFVGGANVIDKVKCDKKVGNDINKHLIALHKYAQEHKPFPEQITKAEYDKVRSAWNENKTDVFDDWYVGCVGFLASYNGRWFDGGYAQPNKTRNYYREAKMNLIKQSRNELYCDIKFICNDYSKITPPVNALIYCDPPYEGTKQYGINKEFNHEKFWEWCRETAWSNYVVISEENAPKDFECVYEFNNILRSIDNRNRMSRTEKIFIYKG